MPSLAEAALTLKERRVIERLVEILKQDLDLQAAWLYGSRARGERTSPDSDVDLLMITPKGREDLWEVIRVLHRIANEEGADPTAFATLVMDPRRVAQRREVGSFFMQEVDRDKVVLHGDP
jgi:predicted nucleotidyltransferase